MDSLDPTESQLQILEIRMNILQILRESPGDAVQTLEIYV
jgi:hypothetical protein